MALARVKVWVAGEVLTASDLNGEFNNILGNATDLVSPFTKAVSMGGFALNFDAANTISLTGVTNGISLTGGAFNTPQGADIASATTINLDTATGNLVDVTGVTTITTVTLAQGRARWVRFTGILTLTNGASLVLPSAANITTAAGDYALFVGYAASVVRVAFYMPASGQAIVGTSTTGLIPKSIVDAVGDEIIGTANDTVARAGFASSKFNGSFLTTVGSNALTIALKGTDGTDPSATNPVYVAFKNVTDATGTPTILAITAATSLVISNGSTLGTVATIANRIWIVGFNDAGTFRLGAVNCLTTVAGAGTGRDVTALYPLRDDVVASSTAEGGAGAADSPQVIYTGTAVTSKAMRVLGYLEYATGLATAGVYASAPTKVSTYAAGTPLPGQVVQTVRNDTGAVATGTTVVPFDDTIPQSGEGDQYMTQAVTPSSTSNVLAVRALSMVTFTVGGNWMTSAIFQDATANAVAAVANYITTGTVGLPQYVEKFILANGVAATTFKSRSGGAVAGTTTFNGSSGARIFAGVMNSFMEVREIAA